MEDKEKEVLCVMLIIGLILFVLHLADKIDDLEQKNRALEREIMYIHRIENI